MRKKKSIFVCEICESRNYCFSLSQNRNSSLNLNKYCPSCKKATNHKESI